MARLLQAEPIVKHYLEVLQGECTKLISKGLKPTLKVLLVGNHPASLIYTSNKKKFCEKIGADCEIVKLEESISESAFLKTLKAHGDDPSVHGLFVQLPLPGHLQHIPIGQLIPAEKDVDGFGPQNLAGLLEGDCGEQFLIPCTPKGILTLLDFNKIPVAGKNVVVIGRSLIVGRPMSLLMLNKDATVTMCHSRTKNLQEHTRRADILITAVGKTRFLGPEYISPTQKTVVIDVGIMRDSEGKICGDVDFDKVLPLVEAITPVPGGVGPLTILSLGQNLIKATQLQNSKVF